MARGASVGRPRRRRALRLSHRERPIGPARQRASQAGARRAGRVPRQESARCDLDHRGHDRRRPLCRMGRVPGRAGALSAVWPSACWSCRATTISISSIAPIRRAWTCRQARANGFASCGRCPRWSRCRAAACGWWIMRAAAWAATLADVLEPHRAQIAEFADAGTAAAVHDAGGPVGQDFSDGAAAGTGRRAGHHAAELERRNAFLLHQCTRLDLGRAGRGGSRSRRRNTRAPAGSSLSITIPSNILGRRKRFPSASAPRSSMATGSFVGCSPWLAASALMHGHRHIDWIGECAGLLIVSAPSPVMSATDDLASYFYIQTFASGAARAAATASTGADHRQGDAFRRRASSSVVARIERSEIRDVPGRNTRMSLRSIGLRHFRGLLSVRNRCCWRNLKAAPLSNNSTRTARIS